MASIVSKLARAATAVASRAYPAAVGGGRSHPIFPRLHLTDRRMCGAAGNKLEKACPKPPAPPPSEPAAAMINPKTLLDAKTLESEEAMWGLYEHWCKFHGKSYGCAEMKRRFKTFKRTANVVHEFNSSGCRGKLGLNQLADITDTEYRHKYTRWRFIKCIRK